MSPLISPEQLAANAQQKLLARKKRKKSTQTKTKTTVRYQTSATQQQGHQSEQRAADFLRAQGLHILAQNLNSRYGEIDIVARSTQTLVFIEVRQRSSTLFGGAVYSVQRDKQQRLKRTAQHFLPLLSKRYFQNQLPFCRFDVMTIEGDKMTWLMDAFS